MCETNAILCPPEPIASDIPKSKRPNIIPTPTTAAEEPQTGDVHVDLVSGAPPPPRHPTLLPTALILLSSLLFSGMHICVRNATSAHHISVLLIAFFRGLFQFVVSISLIFLLGFRALTSILSARSVLTLALRGTLGALAMVCKYATLSRLPVAVASALFSTSPLFATVFGYVFVGELMTLRDAIGLVLTTLGAALVGIRVGPMSGAHDTRHASGVALGLFAAALTGAAFVTVRKLGSKVHFLLSVFALSVGAMTAPLALQAVEGGPFFGAEVPGLRRGAWIALGGVAMFAFAAAVCLNRGLQMTTAGRAALLRTCDIPVNFVVAAVVLGEIPKELTQIAGCVLIAMSTYVVASGNTC